MIKANSQLGNYHLSEHIYDNPRFFLHGNTVDSFYKKKSDEDKTLIFESKFECGNLEFAIKISDNEYTLILQKDTNGRVNPQWYYFSVSNTLKGNHVKFRIVNMVKLIRENQILYITRE